MTQLSTIEASHLDRIRQRTVDALSMGDVAKWVSTKTKINGRLYSFVDHEYQERVMADEAQDIAIRKCSQVGLSEMSIRMALALVALMESYSVIYTFPSATFASTYVKTRVDPVIASSDYLQHAVGTSAVDSAEVKQIGRNFLYFKGAAVSNAAISVSADHLIHDELDFSDEVIIAQYHSRLTHSPYKRKTKLSTPTVPGGPIDTEFQASRRHWNFCKCHHCGHLFIPDYYQHVVIPGYSGDLRAITKESLPRVRYKEAALHCPHCGKVPSMLPEHREWVIENPDDAFDQHGYQVQPFDAPNLISIASLVKASTEYRRRVDFDNFSLGLPAEDAESGFTGEDIEAAGVSLIESPFATHLIGADMGLVCRILVGAVNSDGQLVVVHAERVLIGQFRARFAALCSQYRVTIKVVDTQPYVETILSLQEHDVNLYGAFFVQKKGLELFEVKSRDEDPDEAVTAVRQVSIAKNKVLDAVMDDMRNGQIRLRKTEEWAQLKIELTGLRRAATTLNDGEMISQWIKPKNGMDHYHMALMYLWVAMKMRRVAAGALPASVLGVMKFKVTEPDARK